jgi:hypothetical protein
VGDHLIGSVERAIGAPGFDVSQPFGEPGVKGAALLRGVLVIGSREFGKNRDNVRIPGDADQCSELRP